MECIFCQIVEKQLPAALVYEDDLVVAFNDLQPKAPVHMLIIPRKHIATLNDLAETDTPLMGHILQTAHKLAKKHNIAQPGYRVVNNCNAGAGQSVFHLHFHLLGGRELSWPPG